MLLILLIALVACGAAAGAGLVLLWGGFRLGRDDVRLRSMRAAMDVNHLVIEARRQLVKAALEAGSWMDRN